MAPTEQDSSHAGPVTGAGPATLHDRAGATGPLGAPSPYLEERIAAARTASARVDHEIGEMERLLRGLRDMVGGLERELDRATRELAFVRSSEGAAGAPRTEEVPDRVRPGDPSTTEVPRLAQVSHPRPAGPFESPSPPGRFGRFTVELYNRTVDEIRRRHRIVAPLVLLFSGAIGLTIVVVTLLYGTYSAPLWVALLPTVWLVPVPFFVLTFRGTQRMLHRDHLRLPEET